MLHTRFAVVLTFGTTMLSTLSAAPLYWGGTGGDIADGSTLSPSSGTWLPGTLENWALDAGPAFDYTAWNAGDTATFAAGAAPYELKVSGAVTAAGLIVGPGATEVTIRGSDATTKNFTLSTGAAVQVPSGSLLRLRSGSSEALSIITSGFTKTGSGAFEVASTAVGNSNAAGTIDVQEGILRILGDRVGVFSNESLNLSGASAVVEIGQGTAAISSVSGTQFTSWTGVAGSTIRSTGSGAHFITWLNSTADGIPQNVVLADGTDGSRLGLVKAGSRILTLGTANTYTGGTAVVGGRLTAGHPQAVQGPVAISGSGIFEPSAEGAPGSIVVDAGGTLIAKPSVNHAGLSLNPAASLLLSGPETLPAAPTRLPSWPGRAQFAYAVDGSTLALLPQDFPGVIALGAATAANLDFSVGGGTPLPLARLGALGTTTYSGLLTPHGSTYRLGGGGTLTLDQTLALTGAADVDVGYGSLLLRQNTTAAATVSLTGANDVSGSVAIGRFHTLRLEGASGALGSASAFTLRGGTLSLLDSATAGSNSSRLPDTAPLVFRNGGNVTFIGTRGTTEEAGEVRLEAGEANITASGTGIGSSGAAVLRFAALGSRGATATATFANGTNNSLRFAAQPVLTNGILGGWTVTGGVNFTDINPNNGQPRQVTPVVLADEAAFNGVVATGNYTFDTPVTVTAPANRTVNSLRAHFATGGPFLVDLGPASTAEAPNILTIESGGLLLSSNIAGSIAGGNITAGAGANHALYVFAPATAANSAKTLASGIADNGANPVKLVKAGAGQLILTSANTYTGGTHLNNGNLQIASAANVPVLGTGPISFDGIGTTLSLGNAVSPRTFSNEIRVNADATFSVPSGQGTNVSFSGPVTLASDAVWTITGNVTTLGGSISGGGGLRFNQGATHAINGAEANSFTGPLFLASGTLTLAKAGGVQAAGGDLHIGDNDSSFATEVVILGASDQIADTSLVHLYGALSGNEGTLRLNGDKSETVGGLRSGAGQGLVENGGGSATSAVLTINSTVDSSFGGLLRNHSSGDFTRVLSLTKTGPAVQRLAGRAEHTGPTTVRAGTLQLDGEFTVSPIQVADAGTLSGTGLAGAPVTIQGTHQPGAPGGVQTFAAALAYDSTARLAVRLLANNTDAGTFSAVAGTSVSVAPGAKVDVRLDGPGGFAEFANPFWLTPRSWRILNAAALSGSFTLGNVSPDSDSVAHAAYGSFSLTSDPTGVTLVWTPGGAPLSALQTWRQAHFGSTADAGNSANAADPDRDGISNLVEFAVSSSPVEANQPTGTVSANGPVLEYRYTRSSAAAQYATVRAEWSDDLVTWSSVGISESVTGGSGGIEQVLATVPTGSAGRRYIRVKITLP